MLTFKHNSIKCKSLPLGLIYVYIRYCCGKKKARFCLAGRDPRRCFCGASKPSCFFSVYITGSKLMFVYDRVLCKCRKSPLHTPTMKPLGTYAFGNICTLMIIILLCFPVHSTIQQFSYLHLGFQDFVFSGQPVSLVLMSHMASGPNTHFYAHARTYTNLIQSTFPHDIRNQSLTEVAYNLSSDKKGCQLLQQKSIGLEFTTACTLQELRQNPRKLKTQLKHANPQSTKTAYATEHVHENMWPVQ